MDLAGWPVHALARGQGARIDPWPPLRLGRVRGRADVRRRDLQADRAYRASLQVGGNPRLFDPLHGGADRRGVQGDLRAQQAEGLLRASIAWRGSEVMGVSAQASKIHVAVAAWD